MGRGRLVVQKTRRTLLCGVAGLAAAGPLAGCNRGTAAGYVQTEVVSDVPNSSCVTDYDAVDWGDKELLRELVEDARPNGVASERVEGADYRDAKRQLESLDCSYVSYDNRTILLRLATEE